MLTALIDGAEMLQTYSLEFWLEFHKGAFLLSLGQVDGAYRASDFIRR